LSLNKSNHSSFLPTQLLNTHETGKKCSVTSVVQEQQQHRVRMGYRWRQL
jgi:hypothetical protein